MTTENAYVNASTFTQAVVDEIVKHHDDLADQKDELAWASGTSNVDSHAHERIGTVAQALWEVWYKLAHEQRCSECGRTFRSLLKRGSVRGERERRRERIWCPACYKIFWDKGR